MNPWDVKELDRAAAETLGWVDDLAQRLGWRDRGKAYAALNNWGDPPALPGWQ